MEHLIWLGRYIADKKPERIIGLGDWADMPSLSSYDRGKLASHGRCYSDDIQAANTGLYLFDATIRKYAPRSYKPSKFVTLGNHENRITRHVEANPELLGAVSVDDIQFRKYGWQVSPFLRPVTVDGVTYCHFCPLNAKGRVTESKYGAPSAEAQAKRMMRSTVCGHRQGLDTAVIHTPGRTIRGVIAGSFYQHSEDYLTPLGDTYWRGVLMLNDVRPQTGEFDVCEVSLDFLRRRYG